MRMSTNVSISCSSSSFESVLSVNFLATLDLRAGVEQQVDRLVVQIMPSNPWGGRWIGYWKTTGSTV